MEFNHKETASSQDEKKLLNKVFDDLFPLCRSITGPGLEASIDYFKQYIPLEIEKVASGSYVFDWQVPPEWHFNRARLWGPDGELICDTRISNLHVVNYSEGINGEFPLEELLPHLHSIESLPEAIPYVTSYYQRTWGFCLPHQQLKQLQKGKYKVDIDASFKDDGGVPFAHYKLPGESEKEILLSSYLCHPSLANNELSGPLVLLALYNRIKKWPKRRFSYRFLLNPETIGSLCFLSKYHHHLKEYLEAGMILTCMGGPVSSLRYKASRRGDSIFDLLSQLFVSQSDDYRRIPFSPLGGSDERQYCSPGFNLPMGQMSRSLNDPHTPYHSSLDDKLSMDIDQIIKSVNQLESFLKLSEISGKAVNQSPYGEPQLGKRGLYPNLNSENTRKTSNDCTHDSRWQLNAILTTLSMSDGGATMIDIAAKCNVSLSDLEPVILLLENNGLIKFNTEAL